MIINHISKLVVLSAIALLILTTPFKAIASDHPSAIEINGQIYIPEEDATRIYLVLDMSKQVSYLGFNLEKAMSIYKNRTVVYVWSEEEQAGFWHYDHKEKKWLFWSLNLRLQQLKQRTQPSFNDWDWRNSE